MRYAASRAPCRRRPGRGSKGPTWPTSSATPEPRRPGLALADLLDAARAGETLLLISLADGADALVLRATDAIAAGRGEPLRAQVDRGVTIGYPQYLLWRERIAAERPRRPDPDRPSAPFAWRNRRYKLSMTGGRCRKCGAVQFPLPRVCYQCHAADEFEPVSASGQTARIVTFTVDRLAFSPSPPLVSAIVAFERRRAPAVRAHRRPPAAAGR